MKNPMVRSQIAEPQEMGGKSASRKWLLRIPLTRLSTIVVKVYMGVFLFERTAFQVGFRGWFQRENHIC